MPSRYSQAAKYLVLMKNYAGAHEDRLRRSETSGLLECPIPNHPSNQSNGQPRPSRIERRVTKQRLQVIHVSSNSLWPGSLGAMRESRGTNRYKMPASLGSLEAISLSRLVSRLSAQRTQWK